MPNFKRLTSTSATLLDVNLDAVAYLSRSAGITTIHFAVTGHDGKLLSVSVKEPPDTILAGDKSVPAPSA